MYSGAGILIIEQMYKSKISLQSGTAIVLFKDYKNRYSDLGGKIDKTDYYDNKGKKLNINYVLAKTASREANEESYGLINIHYKKVAMMPYIDIGQYRCYLLVISPRVFYSKYFYHNKLLSRVKEIYDVSRFFIDDLLSIGLRTKKDIQQIIRGRTINIIRKLLNSYLQNIINNPVTLYLRFGNKYHLE